VSDKDAMTMAAKARMFSSVQTLAGLLIRRLLKSSKKILPFSVEVYHETKTIS